MESHIPLSNDHVENHPHSICTPHHSSSHNTKSHTGSMMATINAAEDAGRLTTPPALHEGAQSSAPMAHDSTTSPAGSPIPKNVAFELLVPDTPQYRARLPMRVHIYPHDTTDSIITTVKNFYGLYSGPGSPEGISFEDEQGNTLIARYENLRDNMN